MMKIVFFYIMMVLLALDVCAQSRHYQNFSGEMDLWGRDYLWIFPLDLEQAFDGLKQEAEEQDFELGLESWKDTLLLWASGHNVVLKPKKEATQLFPKGWTEAVPLEIVERLKEKEEEQEFHVAEYFSVYVLVNNSGEVLSVYFRMDPALSDWVREEELQAISDNIKKERFNPMNFVFKRHTKKVVKEVLAKLTDRELDLSGKEREMLLCDVEKRMKPCTYGVLKCFWCLL